MKTDKFTVPNWMQSRVAESIGLKPSQVVVRMEYESRIVFQVHKTRKEYNVNKATGKVIES